MQRFELPPAIVFSLTASLVAMVLPGAVAGAQVEARIDGVVTDTRGNPLEGARITIELEDRGTRMTVNATAAGDREQIDTSDVREGVNELWTDAEGEFQKLGLRVRDRYKIRVELDGYVTFEVRRNLRPAVNQFHIALRPAGGNVGGEAFQAGRAAYEAGNLEEAVEHMNEAVGVLSGSGDQNEVLANALAVLGQSLLQLQRMDEAEESMIRLLEVHENNTFAHQVLGQLYAQRGEFESADWHLSAYVELKPDNPGIHFMFAQVKEQLGDLKAAADHYKRCVELDPEGSMAAPARQALARIEGTPVPS